MFIYSDTKIEKILRQSKFFTTFLYRNVYYLIESVINRVRNKTFYFVLMTIYIIFAQIFIEKQKTIKNMIDVKQTLKDSEEKMEMAAR